MPEAARLRLSGARCEGDRAGSRRAAVPGSAGTEAVPVPVPGRGEAVTEPGPGPGPGPGGAAAPPAGGAAPAAAPRPAREEGSMPVPISWSCRSRQQQLQPLSLLVLFGKTGPGKPRVPERCWNFALLFPGACPQLGSNSRARGLAWEQPWEGPTGGAAPVPAV